MNGMQSGGIGMQSGLEQVFTPQFGVLWLLALAFGVSFALLVAFARKLEFLPKDPGDSAGFCVVGVAITAFIAGFYIGWVQTVFLMLFYVATGAPMIVESKIASLKAAKDKLRDQMDGDDYDSSTTLAE